MAIRTLTEPEAEKICDRRVQQAMSTDPSYVHAEDANSQKAAEESITERVVRDMLAEFNIPDWS
jgi:hypothetical protein